MASLSIEKSYQLQFPVDLVYETWVSSKTVIPPATSMDINPVVGGRYRLIMELPDFTGSNDGIFKVVDPNKFVHYTWHWNNDGNITDIEVTFTSLIGECGTPSTQIDLKHYGFKSSDDLESHSSGWDSYIKGFTEFLTNQSN